MKKISKLLAVDDGADWSCFSIVEFDRNGVEIERVFITAEEIAPLIAHLTKRALDVAKRTPQKGSISGKRSGRSPRQ